MEKNNKILKKYIPLDKPTWSIDEQVYYLEGWAWMTNDEGQRFRRPEEEIIKRHPVK